MDTKNQDVRNFMSDNLNNVINGDALEVLKHIPDESVHFVLTDPPYFIDGMCDQWNRESLNEKSKKASVIGGLPVGMKFDPRQGIKFQQFMESVSEDLYRILKPGGFFVSFSQARLYHRMAIAVENCGFEVRDMLAWKYDGQAKAFSMDHFIKKMRDIDETEKQNIIDSIGGRKTPQLKPQIEPMVLSQKPKIGTFVTNWMINETGLVDVKVSLDGRFPGNVMEVRKPSSKEKEEGIEHLTVKPIKLIEHIIRLFTKDGQIVLDPFMGSGTTGIAAVNSGRNFIGIEKDGVYARIANTRIERARNEKSN